MKMSLNMISEFDNKLLGRKDLKCEVAFTGPTPSKTDIIKMIAARVSAGEDLVVIKAINTDYGEQKATVKAFAYNSMDDLKKLEKVEEKKEEEKPAEETKEAAAPVEEKKEEAKPEEKPAKETKEAAPEEKKEEKGE